MTDIIEMKKRPFILIFILIVFALVYSPSQAQSAQQSDPCGKYNSNSCPSQQCQVQTTPSKSKCFWFICLPKLTSQKKVCVTNPNSQNENKDCFSNNDPNVLTEAKPTSPADLFYEGVKTQNWKFSKIGNNIRIFYPVFSSIASNPPTTQSITPELVASNGNCKYYSFQYQRPKQTITYDLSPYSSTPTTVNGELECYYNNFDPLSSGPSRISLIPGDQRLAQICPWIKRGTPPTPQTPQPTPPAASPELSPMTQQTCKPAPCPVTFPQGPEQDFGFKVEQDSCGNKKITPDNNGQSIAQGDIKQKGEQAVKDCEDTEMPPLMDFPSYCKKSKPPEIIFCKECIDYKNKFGKNSEDEFSCSKIEGGKVTLEPDGKDCKLWQNGGARPGKWDDDTYNSAWGICKNGACTHSTNTLPSGKTCSCNCNGKQIGWDEYCPSGDFICAKKTGKISGLNGNICQSWPELVCNTFVDENGKEIKDENGDQIRSIEKAKEICSNNKLFYTRIIIKTFLKAPTGIKKVECFCVGKPIECK